MERRISIAVCLDSRDACTCHCHIVLCYLFTALVLNSSMFLLLILDIVCGGLGTVGSVWQALFGKLLSSYVLSSSSKCCLLFLQLHNCNCLCQSVNCEHHRRPLHSTNTKKPIPDPRNLCGLCHKALMDLGCTFANADA